MGDSIAEMVNYTIQALWSYGYMLFRFLLFPGLPAPLATTLTSQNYIKLLILKRDKESKSSVRYSTEQHDPYHPLMLKYKWGKRTHLNFVVHTSVTSHIQSINKLSRVRILGYHNMKVQ